MLNWVEYRKELLGRVGKIGQITPDTVKGYKTLSAVTTGNLDAKTYELTALAVTMTTHCDGYITMHMMEAIKHGATHKEIADALSVAISLDAEAALVYSARVLDAVQVYEKA